MSNFKVIETVALEVRLCWCGHYVAIPEVRWEHLEATGEQFYCPYGHTAVYKDTEVARLKKELVQAQEVANSARQRETTANLMLDAERKATKRLLKRVEAGVCPNCHRSFQQLARHMVSKHRKQP